MSDAEALMAEDEDPDYGTLSKEELDQFQAVNAETITALESEIQLLRWKIEQFGAGALPDRDFQVIARADGTSNVEDVENRLEKEIEELTARLKETVRLTGVTIENINRQVLELDDEHCKKQFSLELLLLSRRVHLTYTLDESLSPDERDLKGGKVSWFEIKFEEDINEAVGEDVAKAADELAIHSVFSLLKTYLQWQTSQDQTVKRLTQMYPHIVSSFTNSGGNVCMKITNPKPEHPVFVVEWGRRTVNARVEPDIKLEIEAPYRLIEMDTKNILDSAPEMFATMISSLGLDLALDSLIKLVATDGQNLSAPPSASPSAPPSASPSETVGLSVAQQQTEMSETAPSTSNET